MKSSKKSFTNLSAGLLALTSDSVSSEAIVVCNGRCAYCMHNKLSPAQTLAAKKLTCYWKRKALNHHIFYIICRYSSASHAFI